MAKKLDKTKKVSKKDAKKAAKPRKKKLPLFDVQLTKPELEHIRDLFSILLPSDPPESISQCLAKQAERGELEHNLWEKLSAACDVAGVDLGEKAPDFVVAASTQPMIGLFKVDLSGQNQAPVDVFGGKEPNDDVEVPDLGTPIEDDDE